jgi:secreted trypsin-like serine protease
MSRPKAENILTAETTLVNPVAAAVDDPHIPHYDNDSEQYRLPTDGTNDSPKNDHTSLDNTVPANVADGSDLRDDGDVEMQGVEGTIVDSEAAEMRVEMGTMMDSEATEIQGVEATIVNLDAAEMRVEIGTVVPPERICPKRSDQIQRVKRRWWLILGSMVLLFVIVGLVIGAVVSLQEPTPHQSISEPKMSRPCIMAVGNSSIRKLTLVSEPDTSQPTATTLTKDHEGTSSHLPKTKIIGGNDADNGEYKFYVQLFSGSSGLLCGGSLIAPNVVLTAAHCFVDQLAYVSVGSYELASKYGKEEGYAEHATIIDLVVHPSYNPEIALDYDLMLLKLDESFFRIPPVSLNSNDAKPSPGDYLSVIGLGLTNPDDEYSVAPVLQEVTLQTVATSSCFPENNADNELVNPETEFCASSSGMMGGHDSCQGDSGGPILAVDPMSGEAIQMGVVSWGSGACAAPGESGVYSRISSSFTWIQQIVCDQWAINATFCYQDGTTEGCGSCSSDETDMWFVITVDSFGSELSWDLQSDSGMVEFSDAGFADGETRTYAGCVSKTAVTCYYLTIYDSYGDGMDSPYQGETANIAVVLGNTTYYVGYPDFTTQFQVPLCQ